MMMNDLKLYRVEYSDPSCLSVTLQRDFTAQNWEEANKLLNEHFKRMIIKEFRQLTWISQGLPDGTIRRHIY